MTPPSSNEPPSSPVASGGIEAPDRLASPAGRGMGEGAIAPARQVLPERAPGSGTPRADGARGRKLRGLIALCRARVRATTGARVAVSGSTLVGIVSMVVAIVVRVSDGPDASLGGLVSTSARWVTWVAGAPLALAVAHDRRALDRSEGIEALVLVRGFGAQALESARALGAMIQIALVIGTPIVLLASLSVALSGTIPAALARAPFVVGAAAFAAVAGVTLGGVATVCGSLGAGRGRWLLLAVVVLPWILASELGRSSWSIPGVLQAALAFLLPGKLPGALT
jgi:hypothetical protein